jgi:hypothetical protein
MAIRPLILVCMNELNFDLVSDYSSDGSLPNLERIRQAAVRTTSEDKYDLLEPWIQWASVYSGLSASDHGVYRLGDVVGSSIPQIFEDLEALGLSVGAISPMNAANRLRKPAYFIPDPWTQTQPDDSAVARRLTRAVSQVVNDNAKARISVESALTLGLALLQFARLSNYPLYGRLGYGAATSRKWEKPILFDLFLADLHHWLFKDKKPDFSSLFLNAGAHIQHHYLFNARRFRGTQKNPRWYIQEKEDPFHEVLKVYDRIAGDIMSMENVAAFFVTGLTQKPYEETTFYWRLKDHADFLRALGVDFEAVHPRMTRDFLVVFQNSEKARRGECILRSVQVADDGVSLFEEIDNRGDSLFVTLTYPHNITAEMRFSKGSDDFGLLLPSVAFVAIKNGHHDGLGFFYAHPADEQPREIGHVKNIRQIILSYFQN